MTSARASTDGELPTMVLVGGGHAHLQVLESLRAEEWPAVRTILVTPDPDYTYSGMVPGYLQGTYDLYDLTVELSRLCAGAGAELIVAPAERIDARNCVVHTSSGPIAFTIASLDIGSVPAGLDLPGVSEHALMLRPMRAAVQLRERLDDLAEAAPGKPVRVGVIGGGAGGVEVALAVEARIRARGAKARVVLLERSVTILSEYPRRAPTLVESLISRRGGTVRTDAEVSRVTADSIELASGESIPLDLVIWISGAAPPPLLAASQLPLASDGYFAVDRQLRAADGAPIWGAGDCISFAGRSLPKSGVYAVREAPILATNLRAALGGGVPREYHPQSTALSLLNTADGKAILRWRAMVLHNRAAWWLKDRIDRRFVESYAGAVSGR